jgi:agmatine deiminase
VLKEHRIDYVDIPFLDHKEKNYPNHAIGCYVNHLEVNNLIVFPIFETTKNKDQEVLEMFRQIFPGRKIETLYYHSVGLFGGLLNCSTWTIEE